RNEGADVLARGRTAVVARAGAEAADDTVADDRTARRPTGARHRDARRRPAGPVVAARVPPPRCLRRRPSGRGRRAVVPHGPLPVLVLPTRDRAAFAGAGGTLGRGRR